MLEFAEDRQLNIEKAIEACRMLIKTLSDPYLQPLEREAGYQLAKALRVQVESLGLIDQPEFRDFMQLLDNGRSHQLQVRRFPQDFVDLFNE